MLRFTFEPSSLPDDKELKKLAYDFYLARSRFLSCLERKTQLHLVPVLDADPEADPHQDSLE